MFTVQTLLSSVEFLIHNKYRARHLQCLKFGSKLKYLNFGFAIRVDKLQSLTFFLSHQLLVYKNIELA